MRRRDGVQHGFGLFPLVRADQRVGVIDTVFGRGVGGAGDLHPDLGRLCGAFGANQRFGKETFLRGAVGVIGDALGKIRDRLIRVGNRHFNCVKVGLVSGIDARDLFLNSGLFCLLTACQQNCAKKAQRDQNRVAHFASFYCSALKVWKEEDSCCYPVLPRRISMYSAVDHTRICPLRRGPPSDFCG
ncbi:hypothetical protein GALL_447770 [mine drainage metagenome]|uniref:Uncharacterized protein n=1 Tax=mine drainage metagenome TaxID=410659 RepID=A0A1J5QC92_9ZZZZ